ncbi:SNF2-related protein [uncultured Limosilactobacillus sp.]|uniref:DEAD/DEAH box helicase n=1 Tax=uncultured Limosilactobacillus sp. TaxID=2837629 RepID=UPI0025DE9562|nr:SNF2-related protein [uncultured Limosilactobacillus sp.]
MPKVLGLSFTPRIFERGQEYFEKGKVGPIEWDEQIFSATVQGSSDHEYRVRGILDEQHIKWITCNCPYAEDHELCKHMAAVAVALDHQGQVDADKVLPLGDLIPTSWTEQLEIMAKTTPFMTKLLASPHQVDKLRQAVKLYNGRHVVLEEQYHSKGQDKFEYMTLIMIDRVPHQVTIKYDGQKMDYFIGPQRRDDDLDLFAGVATVSLCNYYLAHQPKAETNQAGSYLLDMFDLATNHDQQLIRPYIELDYYSERTRLNFKVGTPDHMYKLQSTEVFVTVVKRGEPVILGKYFNEVIDLESLDEDSRYWFDFMDEMTAMYNTLTDQKHNYGSTDMYLMVEDVIADRVDDALASGREVYIDNRLNQLVNYSVDDRKLTADLGLELINDQPMLTMQLENLPDKDLIRGHERYYDFNGSDWVAYPNLNPSQIAQAGLANNDHYTFDASDLNAFYRQVLPKIKDKVDLTLNEDPQIDQYILPDAKFTFKFDLAADAIEGQAMVQYQDQAYPLFEQLADDSQRDPAQEAPVKDVLVQYLPIEAVRQGRLILPLEEDQQVVAFLNQGLKRLEDFGEVQVTKPFQRLIGQIDHKPNLTVGISLESGLLNLSVAGEALDSADIAQALRAYHERRPYFKLKNGDYMGVESTTLTTLAHTLEDLGVDADQVDQGDISLPAYQALALNQSLQEQNDLTYQTDDHYAKLIRDFDQNQVGSFTVPQDLQAKLRPYQIAGFQWLMTLNHYHFGGLLADEMGLGKTIQIITLLLAINQEQKLPSLVVAPASVVYNWQDEFHKFAPSLKIATLGGGKVERRKLLAKSDQYDVFITSYDSLKRDIALYDQLEFQVQIIDEAQTIKNARTIGAQTVKLIHAQQRFALTGTPIENRLSELWSIFDYLMPGFLGTYQHFSKRFEEPIIFNDDQAKRAQLSQLIGPFVLRRLKKDVLTSLPAKTEIVEYAEMSGVQLKLYRARADQLIKRIQTSDETDFKGDKIEILAELTRLRQVCCDPHLVYDDYKGKSAKLSQTIALIKDQIENGHKILLFSQFTSMLDIIAQRLQKERIQTETITGAVDKQERQRRVKQFNEQDEPAVFLISLKAGGTGINLTSADVVIHYDPWWNAAAQNQATDRAHRIGQENPVTIYQMITKHTIEERIKELQDKKQALADQVLSGDQMSTTSFDKDELLAILDD